MSFENIFVFGRTHLNIDFSYYSYDELAKYIINNYIKTYRFSFEQMIDKIANDAVEYFGIPQAEYEQNLLLRKLHQYLNNTNNFIRDDNLFEYTKHKSSIDELDELFSDMSVKPPQDSSII